MSAKTLLTADAAIDLALGLALALFPPRLVSLLGIPAAEPAFDPSILGAVLFGIGIALLIERARGASGLGLAGAISINLCGGIVLAGWLLLDALALPSRGRLVLWVLVPVLVGLSTLELVAAATRRTAEGR